MIITCRNGQILLLATLIFSTLFGMPKNLQPMGVQIRSSRELTSPETSNNPEKIVQIGSVRIVAFRQKADCSNLNEKFNSLDKNNGKVILAKADGNSSPSTPPNRGAGPSNFPSSTTGAGARGTGYTPHRNPYRIPPKLNAGLNPAGGPGGPGGDDNPDKFNKGSFADQSQKSKILDRDYHLNDAKKKKQCKLDKNVKAKKTVVYRIKEDLGLVRAAKEACKNAEVQKDVNHLQDQLVKGNKNPGIGSRHICKNVMEHRGNNGGRLYVREADGVVEILAKSGKNRKNQQFVINRLKEIYD